MSLPLQPWLVDLLVSAGILVASYALARLVSFAIGKFLERATRRTETDLDDRLLAAAKRPITYLLFLFGAWWAIARLETPTPLAARLETGLYIVGILIMALALMRAWGLLLAWYVHSHQVAEGLAAEFGPLVSKLGKIFIFLLAAIAVLNRLGINAASLVVSLGVGSLAVGLAAQDTLANMFAGFTLLLDRPFRVGDGIRLASGEMGDVQEIGMRATRIKTGDDTILVVPNSVLVKERVVNLSRPNRNLTARVEVGVAYGTDLAFAKKVLAEAVLSSPYVETERAPLPLVTRFGEFAIQLAVVFWAKDYSQLGLAVSTAYEEIDRRFRANGIAIPYPTRTLIHEGAPPATEVAAE
ncbi:MAG TPA: mechanosensitive ion channel family protein [Vicinamibacteria bacterium]|nr:mechanosensitive ion channel family protein [Vicinamibacteria bacterium]